MTKIPVIFQVRERGEAWGLPILSTYAESEEFVAEGIQFRRAVKGLPPVEIRFHPLDEAEDQLAGHPWIE